jgi:hypothetical protein
MYAVHFGAALAIKSRVWDAPAWALQVGAFLLDLIWIPLATLGVESQAQDWHDDWSHSLLMALVWATLCSRSFLSGEAEPSPWPFGSPSFPTSFWTCRFIPGPPASRQRSAWRASDRYIR